MTGSSGLLVSAEEIEAWARSRRARLLGCDQDEDSFIAEAAHIPVLTRLLFDERTVAAKRATILCALVLMLEVHVEEADERLEDGDVDAVCAALRRDPALSRSVYPQLGLDGMVLLQTLLGDPVAPDLPNALRQRYARTFRTRPV